MKKYVVQIIESERGWGQRCDETQFFDTEQAALDFCVEYNAANKELTVPDWYMYANYCGLMEVR